MKPVYALLMSGFLLIYYCNMLVLIIINFCIGLVVLQR